jgi:phosphoribosyl 1,2-cyclic phosphodiesterase
VIEANHDVEMLKNGPYPAYLQQRILSGSGHLSNVSCGEALVENMSEGLKHVWLCHLSEENNHPELARKTVETILRSHGVIPGKDVELEVLKRKTPTGVYELTIDN